jgi:asparagine synthase (glutamine-hydrolysing)
MKDYLHGEHHKITIDTPQLVDALYKSVDARDLPGMADVDASLLLFCEEVKKSATVALSGECADEIFGGYPWYRDEKIRMIDGFPWAQSTDFRTSFLRDEFASQFDSHRYVNERYKDTLKNTSKMPNLSDLESRMKEMMKLNLMWFMQTLLDRKDRMSMYNGLEVRVPFCDYRIAEYLYAVPWTFKDYQGREKGLLRTAMEGILPDEVLWRKKSPYPKTHHPAYLKAVSDVLRDILSEPSSPLLRIVKPSALEHLLHEDSPVPWYGQLMTIPQTIAYFIQINYWLQAYHIEIV